LKSPAQISTASLSHIKSVFNKVNSDTHLKKVVLENEEFLDQTTDDGASLTGYFAGDSLVKIIFWIGLSYGIQQTDYYYDNNALVFCYVTERHFRLTKTDLDHTKTDIVFEGRYYYNNSSLLEKKTTGSGFWDKENEKVIIPDSKEYFKRVTQKMNGKRH
jgi:hypothetical protein